MAEHREFTVIVERGQDGYLIGSVPELRWCSTQARTMDELFERTSEASALCLEDDEDGDVNLECVGVHRVAV